MKTTFIPSLSLFPYLLVFYELVNYLANDMYLPALPNLMRDFNINMHYAQMTLTMWFLGTGSMQLLLGPLSDRFGRRLILIGGGLVFLLATLVCTLTHDIHIFLVARFFQGCSVCTIGTAGYSIIHEWFSQQKAIQITAVMGSVTILGPAFGPLVGAFILKWFNWRFIFGSLFFSGLIAVFLLYLFMPESKDNNNYKMSAKRIVKDYVNILMNPIFMSHVSLFAITFLGMIAWIATGPFLIIDNFKESSFHFALYQIFIFGSLIIGAQVTKHLIGRYTADQLINFGITTCFIGSLLSLLLTFLFPTFLYGLIISFMLVTFGSSISFSPAQRVAIEACNEPMGARMAIFTSLISLFGVIGLLLSHTFNGTLEWEGGLLFILGSLALMIRIFSKKFIKN